MLNGRKWFEMRIYVNCFYIFYMYLINAIVAQGNQRMSFFMLADIREIREILFMILEMLKQRNKIVFGSTNGG